MQSLSIKVSIGLILVLVAAASASADSSPAPYSPEEWKQVFDRITTTIEPTQDQPAMTVEEVREGLERLLVQVPEEFKQTEEELREHLDMSHPSKELCGEKLMLPSRFPKILYFYNLEPYRGHYKGMQSKLCAQVFIELLESKKISVQDEMHVVQLYSAIKGQQKDEIARGSAEYMKQKMDKKEIAKLKRRRNKELFDNKYNEIIVRLCERVTDPLWDLIDFYRWENNKPFNDVLKDKSEFMRAVEECVNILADTSYFHRRTYVEFKG